MVEALATAVIDRVADLNIVDRRVRGHGAGLLLVFVVFGRRGPANVVFPLLIPERALGVRARGLLGDPPVLSALLEPVACFLLAVLPSKESVEGVVYLATIGEREAAVILGSERWKVAADADPLLPEALTDGPELL
jgi:hypothetical protein